MSKEHIEINFSQYYREFTNLSNLKIKKQKITCYENKDASQERKTPYSAIFKKNSTWLVLKQKYCCWFVCKLFFLINTQNVQTHKTTTTTQYLKTQQKQHFKKKKSTIPSPQPNETMSAMSKEEVVYGRYHLVVWN